MKPYDVWVRTPQGWQRYREKPFTSHREAAEWAREYLPDADVSIRQHERCEDRRAIHRRAQQRYEARHKDDPEWRARRAKTTRAWREANKAKIRAHTAVLSALKKGILVRPSTCERCSGSKPHAHHEDYTKPLEVMWLCALCHTARHRELEASHV